MSDVPTDDEIKEQIIDTLEQSDELLSPTKIARSVPGHYDRVTQLLQQLDEAGEIRTETTSRGDVVGLPR